MTDSGGMTRGQIKQAAVALVRAYQKTDREVDPILLDQQLDWCVQDICRVAESVELQFATDLVSGQSTYCAPQLKFIESAQVVLSPASGSRNAGLVLTDTHAAAHASNGYRITPSTGDPTVAITHGRQSVEVSPAPSYSVAGGLILRGFGVLVNSVWPLDTDTCPLLPAYSHQAVSYCLAERIAEFLMLPDVMEVIGRRARKGVNSFWAESMMLTENTRHRADDSLAVRGPSGPLNL